MDFKKTPPVCNFDELRRQLFDQFDSRNYSANAINTYSKMANVLEKFLTASNISFYNSEVGTAFLEECTKYRGRNMETKPRKVDMMRKMIDRLNCILNGTESKRLSTTKYACPDCFKDEFAGYIEFQSNSGKKEKTVSNMTNSCMRFLVSLNEMGVSSFSEITPQKIYSAMNDYSSAVVFGLYVPPFLKYLHKHGTLPSDYSKLIPSPRIKTPLPTVYEKEEIEALLSAIDKTTSVGKRNYAIILLAARLGIRISDILNLTFNDIDFRRKKIQFVQVKTGVPLSLPLFDEVEQAISDYIAVRTENTACNQIFLRDRAPYIPVGRTVVTSSMLKYFHIARINTKGKKRGIHSLRSSLASALVSENIPYPITQKVLGHEDSNAIKHYVRLDIEQLREYALNVPAPTGEFSVLLGLKEVRS